MKTIRYRAETNVHIDNHGKTFTGVCRVASNWDKHQIQHLILEMNQFLKKYQYTLELSEVQS